MQHPRTARPTNGIDVDLVHEARDHDEACCDFRDAIERDGGVAKFYHSMGLAHQEEKRTRQALKQFEHALRLDPRHVPSHYHKGLMLQQLSRFRDAVAAFTQVLEFAQDDRLVYEARGHVYQSYTSSSSVRSASSSAPGGGGCAA